jgi:hypothetical protein
MTIEPPIAHNLTPAKVEALRWAYQKADREWRDQSANYRALRRRPRDQRAKGELYHQQQICSAYRAARECAKADLMRCGLPDFKAEHANQQRELKNAKTREEKLRYGMEANLVGCAREFELHCKDNTNPFIPLQNRRPRADIFSPFLDVPGIYKRCGWPSPEIVQNSIVVIQHWHEQNSGRSWDNRTYLEKLAQVSSEYWQTSLQEHLSKTMHKKRRVDRGHRRRTLAVDLLKRSKD